MTGVISTLIFTCRTSLEPAELQTLRLRNIPDQASPQTENLKINIEYSDQRQLKPRHTSQERKSPSTPFNTNNFLIRVQYSDYLYHFHEFILYRLFMSFPWTHIIHVQITPKTPPPSHLKWKPRLSAVFRSKENINLKSTKLATSQYPRETPHGDWKRSTGKPGLTFLTRSL